jgi:hypothetical protein
MPDDPTDHDDTADTEPDAVPPDAPARGVLDDQSEEVPEPSEPA